jgi:hypothetical protein
MRKRVALAMLALLASVSWAVFTFRLLPLILLPMLVFVAWVQPRWATPLRVTLLSVAMVGLAWLPIGVTSLNAPGPPRLVRCCCCAPYRMTTLKAALQDQAAGRCVLCSDLVTGFEPTWFLVW